MHALRERIHGTLHSAKEETEAKAGKLKGDVKEILHIGHKGITNIVESVHSVHESVQESVQESVHSVHEFVHGHSKKYDGESSDLLETSIPVVEEKMENSIPVVEEKSNDAVKLAGSESTSDTSVLKTEQCGNKFGEFFANIFEKCCSPFSKKKD